MSFIMLLFSHVGEVPIPIVFIVLISVTIELKVFISCEMNVCGKMCMHNIILTMHIDKNSSNLSTNYNSHSGPSFDQYNFLILTNSLTPHKDRLVSVTINCYTNTLMHH